MVQGGGWLCGRPVHCSADGKYLFVVVANTVRVYSVATGLLVSTLSEHTQNIASCVPNPRNDGQVYTASTDGVILLWDYVEREVAKKYQTSLEILHMAVPKAGKYACLIVKGKAKDANLLQHFSLASGEVKGYQCRIHKEPALSVSADGSYAATFERFHLKVWRPEKPSRRIMHLLATKRLCCVALDPQADRVAAGDLTGRINIWHQLRSLHKEVDRSGKLEVREAAEKLVCTTVHWHAHAVAALCFSLDGKFLLSGGEEAVLVLWHLGTDVKQFLPRLGAPITSITACTHDFAKFVVALANNTIRVVNMATKKVECLVQGIQPIPRRLSVLEAGGQLLGSTGHLALPASNASLQIYDPLMGRHVASLQVVPRNPVSQTEEERLRAAGSSAGVSEPTVTRLAAHSAGSILALVASTPDASGAGGCLSSLQWWHRSLDPSVAGGAGGAEASSRNPFTLHTTVLQPHRREVTSIAFHPQQQLLASAGSEGELRIWALVQGKQPHGPAAAQPSHWRCRSVASYRDEPMTALAFSLDGSMLAAACGATITLWDVGSHALVGTLASPRAAPGAPFTLLAFLHHSPHLIASSGGPHPLLACWHLLSGQVEWQLPVLATSLVSDPRHPACAAALVLPLHSQAGTKRPSNEAPGPEKRTRIRLENGGPHAPATPEGTPGGKASLGAASPAALTPTDAPASEATASPSQPSPALPNGTAASPAAPAAAAGAAAEASTAAAGPGSGAEQQPQPPAPPVTAAVAVFGPASPAPMQLWGLPRAEAASLAFVPRGTALHTHSLPLSPEGMEPLLIVTADRQYSIAAAAEAQPLQSFEMFADQAADAPLSAYHAAFGAHKAAQPVEEGQTGAELASTQQQADRRLQDLFDTPSHILPPLDHFLGSFLAAACKQTPSSTA